MASMEPLNKNILLSGEVVAKKWKIVEKIGEGTFSQIYSAYALESDEKVAIKVEAPSSLKPVLEWESTILKSLQKCPYVCRYYYHGKHAESTVLVMELLGESMSMLRVSPDSIHGVPVNRCISVGLEMLDAIEAFHRHGYVHRDIKASNFALSATKTGTTTPRRYLLIDFGLSRQHMSEGKVLPPRTSAEFRGTSMYASLSAHRRQELGPKDDLWSWFYLVLDFMRGELPWATDAQQKNRQTVFSLKEYYTEKHPELLLEGLAGGSHLHAMIKHLQSLKYEDMPDYSLLRERLKRVETGMTDEDTIELWDALASDRERALQWMRRASDAVKKETEQTVLETLLTVAKKYDTFFDCEGLTTEEHMSVQEAVFEVEMKVKTAAQECAPPTIQSFHRRRLSEQKVRNDALRKRRERDQQIRQSIEHKLRRQSSVSVGSPANDVGSGSATPTKLVGSIDPVQKSDSSMELSDGEDDNGNPQMPPTPAATSVVPPPGPPNVIPSGPRPPPPPPPRRLMIPNGVPPRPPPPPPGFAIPPRGMIGGPPPPPPPRPQFSPTALTPQFQRGSRAGPAATSAYVPQRQPPVERREGQQHRQSPSDRREVQVPRPSTSERRDSYAHRPSSPDRRDNHVHQPRRPPSTDRRDSQPQPSDRREGGYASSRLSPREVYAAPNRPSPKDRPRQASRSRSPDRDRRSHRKPSSRRSPSRSRSQSRSRSRSPARSRTYDRRRSRDLSRSPSWSPPRSYSYRPGPSKDDAYRGRERSPPRDARDHHSRRRF